MNGRTFTKRPIGGNRWSQFALILLLLFLFFLPNAWADQLVLYSSVDQLLQAPWSLFTYGVVHYSWSHLLPSIALILVVVLLNQLGSKYFWLLFFAGVVMSGIAFLLYTSRFGGGVLYGASAGVSSLVVATLMEGAGGTQSYRHLYRGSFVLFMLFLVYQLFTRDHVSSIVHLTGATTGAGVQILTSMWSPKIAREEKKQNAVKRKVEVSGYEALTDEERRLLRQE